MMNSITSSQADDVIGPDAVHLWQSPLKTSTASVVYFRKMLSSDELLRAERFRAEHNSDSFIVARGTARCLLGRYLRLAPDMITIGYGARGKPEVPGIHFSVSHSGNIALFAFATVCAVGVDVEEVRSLPDRDQLAERFFSSEEVAALREIPQDRRDLAFFNCWSAREACVKALGHGLGAPLNDFQLEFPPEQNPRILRIGNKMSTARDWQVHTLTPQPGYVGALAYGSSRQLRLSLHRFPDDFYVQPQNGDG